MVLILLIYILWYSISGYKIKENLNVRYMKIKIGDVELDNRVILVPMAGFCDSAFRTIIKSMGCGLLGTEMVSTKAIMYNNHKTMKLLYTTEYERPISQQLFGPDAESFKIASRFIYEYIKPNPSYYELDCKLHHAILCNTFN